ncbi:aldo/keto reductase [Halocola ammonii]
MKTLKFDNGDLMPALGLGTWKSKPGEVKDAVYTAIKTGFRHIDCAAIYGNEKEVGEGIAKAISEGLVDRKDLWVTSKLWNSEHKIGDVVPALEKTLSDLQLNYLDLYLVHWPVAMKPGVTFPEKPEDFLSLEEAPLEKTWEGMEGAKKLGLAKHIGVSNFNIKNLRHIIAHGKVKPEMNQVELHPYLQQEELFTFCHKEGIFMTGYSPLGSTDRSEKMKKDDEPILWENDLIKEMAKKYDCTPQQFLIAWSLNRGNAVIPKSVNPDHIKSNFDAKDIKIDHEDMVKMTELDRGYRFVDGHFWTMEGNPYNLDDLWD